MNTIIITLLALFISITPAQAEEYGKGEEFYQKRLEKRPQDAQLRYNLGGVMYEQGKYAQAIEEYLKSLGSFREPLQRAGSFYNLGNTYFRAGDYKKAIKAYEDTLGLTPEDEDAKYNLELAKKRLEEEKQKQEAQDEQEEKDKEKQEQEQDKEKQEQNQEDQEKQESEEEQDQEQEDQDKQEQEEQEQDQEGQEQEQEKQEQGMSEEDAQRILNALDEDEDDLMELHKNVIRGTIVAPEKDW